MAAKPRVLILGGLGTNPFVNYLSHLGFIGKNLVEYILQNDLARKVRVVDKKVVFMANLSKVRISVTSHDNLIIV